MQKLSVLPIPLYQNKTIHFEGLEQLVKKDIFSDAFVLFSPTSEGNTFLVEEKKEIYQFLKEKTKRNFLYEISGFLSEEESKNIQELKPDGIIFTLLKEAKLSSRGHEAYLRQKMKNMKDIPFYVHHEKGMDDGHLNLLSLLRLKKTFPSFKGILEENMDYSFLMKVMKTKKIALYLSLKNALLKPKILQIEGVFSDLIPIFGSEIAEYFTDEQKFTNSILKDYLLFAENCIEDYPRAMAMKYLLSQNMKMPVFSRLPYYHLDGEEKNQLDFLL